MYAEDDKHSQQMALSFELKGGDRWVILSIEAYDYDFELIGGRIVYNNYFAQTPFFILIPFLFDCSRFIGYSCYCLVLIRVSSKTKIGSNLLIEIGTISAIPKVIVQLILFSGFTFFVTQHVSAVSISYLTNAGSGW